MTRRGASIRYRAAVEAAPRIPWGDLALAIGLAGLAIVEIWLQPVFQTGLPGPRAGMTVLALLATIPVAVRRSRPLVAGAVVLSGLILAGVVGDPEQAGFPLFLSLALVTWSVATVTRGATAARAFALLMLGAAAYEALTFAETDSGADLVVPVVLLIAVWTAGGEVRRLRDRARIAADREALAVEQHAAHRRDLLQGERDRIARELHDVVASALSIVGVQAAAVSRSLPVEDVGSRAGVATIERVARDAVLELQRMLQVLRAKAEPPVLPTGLEALPDLVRDSGLEVDLSVSGELTSLAPGLQLTALRIVQEALTNVRKHSGTRRCQVRVDVGSSHVEVLVVDHGTGARAPSHEGLGLVGMAERVRLVGGTLEAGPAPDRGFVVLARLPRAL